MLLLLLLLCTVSSTPLHLLVISHGVELNIAGSKCTARQISTGRGAEDSYHGLWLSHLPRYSIASFVEVAGPECGVWIMKLETLGSMHLASQFPSSCFRRDGMGRLDQRGIARGEKKTVEKVKMK